MKMASTVISFLLFLGVFAFFADSSSGATTALAQYSPPTSSSQQIINTMLLRGTSVGVDAAATGRKIGRGGHHEFCKKDDIQISQSQTGLINGIPRYTVEITNTCTKHQCDASNIHVSCGNFTSVYLVNPKTFRRLRVGDCLFNNGDPFPHGHMTSFVYVNSRKYDLSVASAFFKCQ